MKAIAVKYKTMISYLIFGALTTAVNMAVYALCYRVAGISNIKSTVAAWCVSVLFAFMTNKQYVFHSKARTIKGTLKEAVKFAGGRLGTGAVEVAVMYVAVDLLGWPGVIMKLGANVIVIVLNYIISKRWIFSTKTVKNHTQP